jgi:hypothetical protein
LGKLIIYTDENVDVRLSEGLKKRGITSFSAIKKGMSGSTDIQHLEYAEIFSAEEMKNQIEFL